MEALRPSISHLPAVSTRTYSEKNENTFQNLMSFQEYYRRHFPARQLDRFCSRRYISKGGVAPYHPDNREYGIETTDGIFIRYRSCPNEQALRDLVAKNPNVGKLNIGAVFEQAPSLKRKTSSQSSIMPIGREFVIDIDLTDYEPCVVVDKNDMEENDVHWPLVAFGLMFCKNVLMETFGFEHLLIVYSGRRGGHIWVLDERAFVLEDSARSAIVSFMQPGSKASSLGRQSFNWILAHPTFGAGMSNPLSATEIGKESMIRKFVFPFFKNIGISPRSSGGLGFLDTCSDRQRFLAMMEFKFDGPVEENFVMRSENGKDAFKILTNAIKNIEIIKAREFANIRLCETVCSYVWPRIDANVSSHINHTLKSPFSVHPGTGRVSVPIFKENLLEFKPAMHAPVATQPMPESFLTTVREFDSFLTKIERKVNAQTGMGGESDMSSEW